MKFSWGLALEVLVAIWYHTWCCPSLLEFSTSHYSEDRPRRATFSVENRKIRARGREGSAASEKIGEPPMVFYVGKEYNTSVLIVI